MTEPIDIPQPYRREVAFAVLSKTEKGTRRAGQFLGGLMFDHAPMSDKQLDWFLTLAERAGVEVAPHG